MPEPTSTFIGAPDGLKLHVREFGSRMSPRLPVVCLPGLTRTAEDFDVLAAALAGHPERPRRVLALDSRGRGRSDYDRDVKNYTLVTELADLMAVLTACNIQPAVFVGSSRGGLLTMMLATMRPTAIAGAILNDIGPVIELQGLMRIKGYVGKLPVPRTFEEGGEVLRRLFDHQFPNVSPDAWVTAAKRTWRQEKKRFVLTYDIKIAETLKDLSAETALPPMWPQFEALASMPLMAIRGANSDILSAETLAAMRQRRADLDVIEVPGEGHTPLLADEPTIEKIAAFVDACDRKAARPN